MDGPGAPLKVEEDEDEEEEYDESERGNRLLGFMFGNVDDSGDLDVDYLDEDAKEHFAALANKLGPTFTDIDITKSPSTPAGASELDYDEKAEDAIDYEDIEEQYEGPEVQATTEEDHLFSKQEYFSQDVSLDSLNLKTSIFDEENYDEDEDVEKEIEPEKDNLECQSASLEGKELDTVYEKIQPWSENVPAIESCEDEPIAYEEDFEENSATIQHPIQSESGSSLPVLYVEDGTVILRFSEIFGIHEPLKRKERRDNQRFTTNKERAKGMDLTYSIEEDEAAYLRSAQYDPSVSTSLSLSQDFYSQFDETITQSTAFGVHGEKKDSCLPAEPMKEGMSADILAEWISPLSTRFYPLDQQNWEDEIIWGNSPPSISDPAESFPDTESEDFPIRNVNVQQNSRLVGEDGTNEPTRSCASLIDISDGIAFTESASVGFSGKSRHPQMLRLESRLRNDGSEFAEIMSKDRGEQPQDDDFVERFKKLSGQNKDLLGDSWLKNIIWDASESLQKPKLILDLQDERMLFEISESDNVEKFRSHASAMIITHTPNSTEDSLDVHGLNELSAGRFDISNDKYYSNRKNSQEMKINAKKHSIGIKVMHCVPALRLQTMKPKLSNKELTHFHRPKASWYPRDNKEVAKLQKESYRGQFKIILKTLAGKLTLLHVNSEDVLTSVLAKASKKLDFRSSENIKIFYSGKELEDGISLASQGVRWNSILYVVRTNINLWPRTLQSPGEGKPLRPPGAFKKKSDLSVKDGHVFMVEYCEERPLLLGNVGMGARLCTYYQKLAPNDQTASTLQNENTGLGTIVTLNPTNKSPFLGEIGPGCSQSSLETNMYRAPIFPHELPTTDYLLVRSAKGTLSLRRIDKIYAAGQQEPHMEVMAPGTKNVQNYIVNRLTVYVYRECCAKEKLGFIPSIRVDELASQFPSLPLSFMRKKLKNYADVQRHSKGHLIWVLKPHLRTEQELRNMVTPEEVCSYESMQAGLHRLKSLGIKNLTYLPVGLSAAISRLPDEAIALAAASHIERELQITPWNLSSNFVACTKQDRGNIERLEITGVGDPSGRGLGFSYVRVAPKVTGTNSSAKKKAPLPRGGTTVTGTDADLRRLSMDAAREVLLKFNVPDESIGKMTRWHRIAMIRKLSSEQTSSDIKVDAATLSKFARGQRMSFSQLQQQTREKCQEIWDRQVQSLSAADEDENGSDSDANSDLDSFAGDLENLLDAEEFEGEEGHVECKGDKVDSVRGFKMRRCPSQSQTVEEIEDDKAEAAEIRRLFDGDISDSKKKKKVKASENEARLGLDSSELAKRPNSFVGQTSNLPKIDASFISEALNQDLKEIMKDKKPVDKPVRENFVCGACGQLGHMRTNKNCPKYGEDPDASELENIASKSHLPEATGQVQLKMPYRKLISKSVTKTNITEASENSPKSGGKSQPRVQALKLKCVPPSKQYEPKETQSSMRQIIAVASDAEKEAKSSGRINKLIISNKMRSDSVQPEPQKPSVVIRLPVEADRDRPPKKIVIKQAKSSNMYQARQTVEFGVDENFRKTKKIAELTGLQEQKNCHDPWLAEETTKREASRSRVVWEEEDSRLSQLRIQEEHQRLYEARMYEETQRREMEEQARLRKKKKKKKKPDFGDDYLEDYRSSRKERRTSERDRAAKRRPVVDLGRHLAEHGPPTKRRRGGEVVLSNILESIVDKLRENTGLSYLFLKPVTKKEAPDYFDVIKDPMDLSTIKEKVRRMEYKDREDFRHDVWQITYNAHAYNDGRNPGIPPLADQLLELCDYLLDDNDEALTEAEAGIESRDF